MTESQLRDFVRDNGLEWHWHPPSGDPGDPESDVFLVIRHDCLREFAGMLGYNMLADGGLEVRLMDDGYVGIDMRYVCEYHDVDLESAFPREEET